MHGISATYYDDADEDSTEQSTISSAVCFSCLQFRWFFKRRQRKNNSDENEDQRPTLYWCFQRPNYRNNHSRRKRGARKNTIGLIDNNNNWVYMDPETAEKYKNKNQRLSILLEEQLADPTSFNYDYHPEVRRNHGNSVSFVRYSSSLDQSDSNESSANDDTGKKSFMKLLLYTEEERRSNFSKDNAAIGNLKERNVYKTTLDPLDHYFMQNKNRDPEYINPHIKRSWGTKDRCKVNCEKSTTSPCKIHKEKKDIESESFIVSPKRRSKYIDSPVRSEEANKYINVSIGESHSTENTVPETDEMRSSESSFSDTYTFVEFMGYLENVEFENVSAEWWQDNCTLNSAHEEDLILKSIRTIPIKKGESNDDNLLIKCTKKLVDTIQLILPVKSKAIDKNKIRVIVNNTDSEDGSDSDPYHLLKRSKVELDPIDLQDITIVAE